jgi:uncharacterized protein
MEHVNLGYWVDRGEAWRNCSAQIVESASMNIVIDTNIFISSMLTPTGNPARILEGWQSGAYQVIVCQRLLDELTDVASRSKFAPRISFADIETLISTLRSNAVIVDGPWPEVTRSPDPKDNYLLALAEKSGAAFLVTGDRGDLLPLETHGPTRILTARAFLSALAAT